MRTVKKSEVSPAGGVVNTNDVQYLFDDVIYNKEYIDVHYEAYMAEKPDDVDENEYNDEFYDDEFLYYTGFIKGDDGLYDIDYDADYTAIITPLYTQILHSKYMSYCYHCSPCFPSQNNLDDDGDNETYVLPPELYDDEFDKHLEIFEIIEG